MKSLEVIRHSSGRRKEEISSEAAQLGSVNIALNSDTASLQDAD